jgi:mannose-6-phosphate isomerase-like protein (cupin superfamily)
VEEIWHFLEGEGLFWRKEGDVEETIPVSKGMTVFIRPQMSFQFCNTGTTPLCFVVITTPTWPGPSEAVQVPNHWPNQ